MVWCAGKFLAMPLIKRVLGYTKKAGSGEVFKERILEASKFIAGSSCQSSIISINIYH